MASMEHLRRPICEPNLIQLNFAIPDHSAEQRLGRNSRQLVVGQNFVSDVLCCAEQQRHAGSAGRLRRQPTPDTRAWSEAEASKQLTTTDYTVHKLQQPKRLKL